MLSQNATKSLVFPGAANHYVMAFLKVLLLLYNVINTNLSLKHRLFYDHTPGILL